TSKKKALPPADDAAALARQAEVQDPASAADLLSDQSDTTIVDVLQRVSPGVAQDILAELSAPRQSRVFSLAPGAVAEQWQVNQGYGEDAVGWLMEPPLAVFTPGMTVAETVERVRELAKKALVTYGFVVDTDDRFIGLVTMRDLLLSERTQKLADVMLREPFALKGNDSAADAMKEVLHRHFPVYPVVDDKGRLVGQVRGNALFQERVFELSAQAGTMVGVDTEERLATPWPRSLRFRHGWLQLNLLTAFLAAAVVGYFQGTIDRLVILAMFLPVLAGQSGNTGCQALAVTLRGMTLGELDAGKARVLVAKEALLGFLNGGIVGLVAAGGMAVVAFAQHAPNPWGLAAIVWVSLTASCIVSGLAGALIPLALKRFGFDPATASSIFLTTMTDVCSMGVFLLLATILL
ncbi:MAG TPA: magnesium transporter, partial [Gemmatimonadales bacterium]|nr:magnesium transporter [Gemmatimonadales bacterium]